MADENNLEINIGINPANAESGARRTSAAVGSVVNEAKEMGTAFNRLKAALDPSYAAQQKYTRAVEEFDRQLKAGKLTQQQYAQGVESVKRAFDTQLASIERNSAAAKRAAQEKSIAILQEASARERSATEAKRLADQWVQIEQRNTQALRQELQQRKVANKAYVDEAVRTARQAAQARIEAERAGGATVTRGAENRIVADAARAAKQAARERVVAEDQANDEIYQSYQETYQAAKVLSAEAAATMKATAADRAHAETAVTQASLAVEKAERREAAQVARQTTAVASQAAKERAAAEKQVTTATKEQARATEEAARAARREANSLNEVRASINPAFAAQQRYNQTMQQATALLMANKLQQGEWTQVQRQAKIQMDINTRSLGRMNQAGVQMGYQIQDVTASIASGINPMVIFAQQSGQVAYALQGMGGKASMVASILGGIWVQAGLAAVYILYQLWSGTKDQTSATIDLTDAEAIRAAGVSDLNDTIDEYIKKQKEANTETSRANDLAIEGAKAYRDKVILEMNAAVARRDRAKTAMDTNTELSKNGRGLTDPAAVGALYTEYYLAQRAVDSLTDSYNKAMKAETQAAITAAKHRASLTSSEAAHEAWTQSITDSYEKIGNSRELTAEDQKNLEILFRRGDLQLKEAQDREARATKNQIGLNEQLYKSRNDAISIAANSLTKQGFYINPNHSDPTKIGKHPGMGAKAHADHAIDVNIPGIGNEASDPVAKMKMDEMVRQYQAAGFRVLWNGRVYEPPGSKRASYDIPANKNQHTDHAHIEAPANLVGRPVGMGLAKGMVSGLQELETEAQKAAKALVEVIDTREQVLKSDGSPTVEKLHDIITLERQRVGIITKAYGKGSSEAEKAKQHEIQVVRRYNALVIQEETRKIDQEQKLQEIKGEASDARSRAQLESELSRLEFLHHNSLISDNRYLQQKALLMDREFQESINRENRIWTSKKAYAQREISLEGQTADKIRNIQRDLERGELEHQRRLQDIKLKYAQTSQSLQQEEAQKTLDSWKGVTDTFSQSLGSSLQQLWMKQTTISQALLNMADQMVFKLMELGRRELDAWIMKELKKLIFGKQTSQALLSQAQQTGAVERSIQLATGKGAEAAGALKTAAAVKGAATQQGVSAAAGTAEITNQAAQSAAGAYKSTVVIPFIGPVAAPAAAALALAAVLGFASLISAEGGAGEIKRDGQLARLHAKEMVLPAWIAEPLRQSLSAPSSSGMMLGASMAGAAARTAQSTYGDSFEFNYQPKHTNMGATMDELLRRDGQRLRKWIKNEIRNGNIKGGSL